MWKDRRDQRTFAKAIHRSRDTHKNHIISSHAKHCERKMRTYSHVLLLASWFAAMIMRLPTVQSNGEHMNCTSNTRKFQTEMHKKKYRVAFQATRGKEDAFEEYNKTLSHYLQNTAGRRFDQDIMFEMVPMTAKEIFEGVENEDIDFLFASDGVFACIGVQHGLQLLATRILRVSVRGHTYDLDTDAGRVGKT
jgi:hypothetical protein